MGLYSGPKHTTLYVCSLVLLLTSLALFIVGLSAPFWTMGDVEAGDDVVYVTYQGLWLNCAGIYGDVECANAILDVPVWFQAVQGLQLVALVLWVGTTGYGAVANCWDPRPSHAAVLVIGTFISCIVSFVSLMIFVGKVEKMLFTSDLLTVDLDYYWAFALDLVGTLLGVFAAVGIAISYRRHPFTPSTRRDTGLEPGYTPGESVYPTGVDNNVYTTGVDNNDYNTAEGLYTSAGTAYSSSRDAVYQPSEEMYPTGEAIYTSREGAYP